MGSEKCITWKWTYGLVDVDMRKGKEVRIEIENMVKY
jgi:hypothetical protein